MKRVVVLAAVFVMALAGSGATVAAAQVESESGPADMVGTWTAQFSEGPMAGRRAADLEIALGPSGPEIVLVLYRYGVGSAEPAKVEHPPVVEHRVEKGVLYFRTRDTVQLEHGQAAETVEADWKFSVVDQDSGLLEVRDRKHAAERSEGKDVPPPPPPLRMKRVH